MKFNNFLICALLSAGMMGCGGSQNLDASTAPQSVQRMLSGGVQRSTQADAESNAAVSIAGYRDNFTIVKNQTTNVVTVTSKIDNSVATYQNPSLIKFVDKWVSFDIDGPAGQVYRLYQAAFNRKPDLPGLGFWIYHNANGMSITDISSNFIASDEFKSMYGATPSDAAFVDSLYQNVLHRAGEPAGVAWWQGILRQGTDRRYVLFGFADSAENKGNLAQDVQNGFDYVPFNQGGPIVPKASSYENKIAAAAALGPQKLPAETTWANAVAFADFFQDGTYSMVTHSLIYDRDNPATANQFGSIHFYKNVNGSWVEKTSELLSDIGGCIHPRKAIVADFNGDGKPDVYFACHGFDSAPFSGEHPHVLLSQTDGKYKNQTLPTICYCHGASASEGKVKGYADILVTDNQANERVPYFLINKKDGTFTQDFTRLPFNPKIYLAPNTNYGAVVMYDAELIDFDGSGKYDAFLAGTEAPDDASGIPPTIFKNDGTGHYGKPITLPTDSQYQTTLDIVYLNGNIYLNRVQTKGGAYGFSSIQKVNYKSLAASRLYTNTENFANGSTWLNWIIPYQGNIVSQSAVYGVSVPQ